MNKGIQRFVITDKTKGRGARRFYQSYARRYAATNLYRKIFAREDKPLLPGYGEIKCSKNEFMAGYDHALGIDVLLNFIDGSTLTLQEKFLFYRPKTTITIEYMQDWRLGIPGDWFNMKTQLYFVGYDREHDDCKRVYHRDNLYILKGTCPQCHNPFSFQEWMLLNWPSTKLAKIDWQEAKNASDGARASFRWEVFTRIPDGCVISDNVKHSRKAIQRAFAL